MGDQAVTVHVAAMFCGKIRECFQVPAIFLDDSYPRPRKRPYLVAVTASRGKALRGAARLYFDLPTRREKAGRGGRGYKKKDNNYIALPAVSTGHSSVIRARAGAGAGNRNALSTGRATAEARARHRAEARYWRGFFRKLDAVLDSLVASEHACEDSAPAARRLRTLIAKAYAR